MRSPVALGGVLVGLVVLSGCGGGSEPSDARPTPTVSSSGTPSASTPAVAPADGKEVHAKYVTYRLTSSRSWLTDRDSTFATRIDDNGFGWVISYLSSYTARPDLAVLVHATRSGYGDEWHDLHRGADRTVDGRVGYVLEGVKRGGRLYEWGTADGSDWLRFVFEVPDGPESGRTIDSVLASVHWAK